MPASRPVVVPVIGEKVVVGKRSVEKGRVKVHKRVNVSQTTVDVTDTAEVVSIERTVINRVVREAPKVRVSGTTTIIPIVEERMIVTTQLVLVEEIRIHKQRTKTHHQRDLQLRKEEIEITRAEPEQG
jgi:uncharacterized protein (TIGR02271 family)